MKAVFLVVTMVTIWMGIGLLISPTVEAAPPDPRNCRGANTCTLTVGVRVSDNFVINTNAQSTNLDNQLCEATDIYQGYCGFVIELLEKYIKPRLAAQGYNVQFSYSNEADYTVNELITKIAAPDSLFDIGAGNISITEYREQNKGVNFSVPFVENANIKVMERKQSWLESVGEAFWRRADWLVPLLVFTVLILIGIIYLERRKIYGPIKVRSKKVASYVFYWMVTPFADRDHLDPSNRWARRLAITWRIVAVLFIIPVLTATITSEFTIDQFDSDPSRIVESLRRQEVLTVAGSTSADLLRQQGVSHVAYVDRIDDSIVEAFKNGTPIDAYTTKNGDNTRADLAPKAYDAIVYDGVILELLEKKHTDKLEVRRPVLQEEGYGFAFSQDSPWRTVFSNVILMLREEEIDGTPNITSLKERWL